MKKENTIRNYDSAALSGFLTELFFVVGLNKNDSKFIAKSLVESNLCGYDSHGILRVPHYISRFENGTTKKITQIKIKELSTSLSLVDGGHGAGQIVARDSILKAIEMAEINGIGCVGVKNSNHFGRAGYFTNIAVEKGMIGIAMTHTDTNTLPYGGAKPYFGSNALAFSSPTGNEYPICIDFSMTSLSFGKIYDAELKKINIPEGSAVDEDGVMTIKPDKVSNLIPAAGYKGFGLSLMIEVLCAILTGNPFAHNVVDMYKELDKPREIGHFFIAIDISKFRNINYYLNDITQMILDLHSIPPQKGFDGVKIPGELEYKIKLERSEKGIPLPIELINDLKILSEKFNISFPT